MKYTLPLLALASSAVATFRNAKPFTCPANTDNKCTDQQKPGFAFDDIQGGPFSQYKDFFWNGWTAHNGGRFGKRTLGKSIGGICGPNKKDSPSFGCGPKVDKFSLGSIHVQPEFDCDLEFHYDMPDGKICKHRNFCRKTGTTVVNTQCGGAKNVTIVYPPQPDKPKPSCSIVVPTVSFDCSTASSTVPPKTTATSTPATSTVETTSTTETSLFQTTTTACEGTTCGGDVPSSSAPSLSVPTPVVSSTLTSIATSEVTSVTSVKPIVSSSSFLFPNSSTTSQATVPETSVPGTTISETTISETPASETTSVPVPETTPATTEHTTTFVTTFDSTSTVFTTIVSTITSCEPTVPECPGNGVATTVVTVATSTTICPVTETVTSVVTSKTPDVEVPGTTDEGTPTTETTAGGITSTATGTVVKPPSTTSSISPIETLPCPDVVPSCLNTFLFSVGCSHNSDAACYCPDTLFVKNIFDCIYAHGESDQVVSEAVIFFQGICAPYIGSNPGIATDATVTTYITATATPTVSVVTTVTLDVTTVVPCTDSVGSTIPSSSTTTVLSTTLTVPQVGFTTGTNDEVNIIPVTTALPAVTETGGSGLVPTDGNGFFTTPAPTGTGGLPIPSSIPGSSIVTAGAGRAGTAGGVGLAVAVAGFIAAVL